MKTLVISILSGLFILSMPVLAEQTEAEQSKQENTDQVIADVNALPETGSGKQDDCE